MLQIIQDLLLVAGAIGALALALSLCINKGQSRPAGRARARHAERTRLPSRD